MENSLKLPNFPNLSKVSKLFKIFEIHQYSSEIVSYSGNNTDAFIFPKWED